MKGDAQKILVAKLRKMFPQEALRAEARAILESYGLESHEREPERVRLAVLKLSGSDLDQVRRYADYAKEDYRDVLTWAEYPNQGRYWRIDDEVEKARLRKEDWQQYEEWLEDI